MNTKKLATIQLWNPSTWATPITGAFIIVDESGVNGKNIELLYSTYSENNIFEGERITYGY